VAGRRKPQRPRTSIRAVVVVLMYSCKRVVSRINNMIDSNASRHVLRCETTRQLRRKGEKDHPCSGGDMGGEK
jgi:hypothetical protein